MTQQQSIEEILVASGTTFAPLAREERWALMQAWREVFARGTFERTGQWRIPDFEWHTFSSGNSRAKTGARAEAAYASQQAHEFIVWPEDGRIPMYRCRGNTPPNFAPLETDIYVFPPDLSWTMAFTHEVSMHLGPYFALAEQQ